MGALIVSVVVAQPDILFACGGLIWEMSVYEFFRKIILRISQNMESDKDFPNDFGAGDNRYGRRQ
jgi:hypothetical protein